MNDTSARLHAAFVGGFRPYLNASLEERGLPELDPAVLDEAEQWLDAALRELLELPYLDQRRSPLEIVQEAMAGPTSALEGLGARPVLRDPVATAALPGDVFSLAPASSAGLGDEAFQAHLAWGAAKAQALAPLVSGQGRRVVLLSGDLMDRSRFEDAVNAAGLRLVPWEAELGPRPVVGFVDLASDDSDEAIRGLSDQGVRVIAYGPHVDEDAMERAATLGAHTVVPRSRLFKQIGAYLPRLT